MILNDGEKFDLKGRNYSYKNFSCLNQYDDTPLFFIPPGIQCEITNSDVQRVSILSAEKNECRAILVKNSIKMKILKFCNRYIIG